MEFDVIRKAAKQVGISPKVYIPAVAQVIVGFALILLGLDVEGKTAIATGIGTFLAGTQSNPGTVVVEPEPQDTEGA